jgi:hypothetical protein
LAHSPDRNNTNAQADGADEGKHLTSAAPAQAGVAVPLSPFVVSANRAFAQLRRHANTPSSPPTVFVTGTALRLPAFQSPSRDIVLE